MIHSVQMGEGPDLVMVHGWGLNAKIWEPVIELLAKHFRLTLIDLPGHGNSPLDEEFTMKNIVESLRNIIPQNAILLGWSLGGMISLMLCAQHPAHLKKLILLASNPCFVTKPDQPSGMTPELLEQFGNELIKDYSGTIAKFLAASTLGAKDGQALLRQLLRNINATPQPNVKALQGGLEILRNTDLRPELKNISCPTLVLLGKRDALVPADIAKEYNLNISDVRVEIISGAGHAPFLSHPETFVKLIRDFAA